MNEEGQGGGQGVSCGPSRCSDNTCSTSGCGSSFAGPSSSLPCAPDPGPSLRERLRATSTGAETGELRVQPVNWHPPVAIIILLVWVAWIRLVYPLASSRAAHGMGNRVVKWLPR